MNIFLKDSDGKRSATVTAFVFGFVIVNLKLLLSGLTIGDYKFSDFTGSDYALALSALGGVYILRRNQITKKEQG